MCKCYPILYKRLELPQFYYPQGWGGGLGTNLIGSKRDNCTCFSSVPDKAPMASETLGLVQGLEDSGGGYVGVNCRVMLVNCTW